MGAVEDIKNTSIENERAFREQLFRDEITEAFKEGKIAIANGWLVEVVNEHTCGTGPNGHYGQHEPGCGTIPIMDLWRE